MSDKSTPADTATADKTDKTDKTDPAADTTSPTAPAADATTPTPGDEMGSFREADVTISNDTDPGASNPAAVTVDKTQENTVVIMQSNPPQHGDGSAPHVADVAAIAEPEAEAQQA